MKKIYLPLLIISSLLFSGCSKDFLKPYEDRVIGSWYISDINRVGLGGSAGDLPFQQGTFEFNQDGSLVYTNAAGNTSNGYWEIQKRRNNDEVMRTLHVTAVDFNTQQVQSEFYDEMNFRSTDHFVGKINSVAHSFVTHFRRQ